MSSLADKIEGDKQEETLIEKVEKKVAKLLDKKKKK